MNTLVASAIVGTGQTGNNDLITNTPIDALATQLPADNTERSLLLTAGAWAVYRQAGYCAEAAPAIPQLAPAEVQVSCPAKAALLLANLLQGEHSEVLPEALDQLQKAHLRLPHDSLPQALAYGTRNKQVRTALVPISAPTFHPQRYVSCSRMPLSVSISSRCSLNQRCWNK